MAIQEVTKTVKTSKGEIVHINNKSNFLALVGSLHVVTLEADSPVAGGGLLGCSKEVDMINSNVPNGIDTVTNVYSIEEIVNILLDTNRVATLKALQQSTTQTR